MVAFSKYHGLGNDFIIVDLRHADEETAAGVQDPTFVRAACDRAFGIGGDGVLALLPARSPEAAARMRVLNSDGSEAEMCGNGIRCVARYLRDEAGVAANPIAIDTGAGLLRCQIEGEHDASGGAGAGSADVTVDMGRPRWRRGEIPVAGGVADAPADAVMIEADGLAAPVAFACVSMGNPHAVAFVGSRDEAWALATRAGRNVETHPLFPARTNVEFASVRARAGDGMATEIDLVVWERGCGITLACGTGACATAVAACRQGLAQPGATTAVNLPGGSLRIRVDEGYERVWMTGPARRVATGHFAIAEVLAARRPAS